MPKTGFSLAELLISVMILSIISIFSIPKLIRNQQNSSYEAMAKEIMGDLSSAFQTYKVSNGIRTSTISNDLLTSLNYVRIQTTGLIDHVPGNTSLDCGDTVSFTCWKLHNGAVMLTRDDNNFGVANNQHYILYWFDPDGIYSGSINGQGKSLVIRLYYNGRTATSAEHRAGDNTYFSTFAQGFGSDTHPSWYSW